MGDRRVQVAHVVAKLPGCQALHIVWDDHFGARFVTEPSKGHCLDHVLRLLHFDLAMRALAKHASQTHSVVSKPPSKDLLAPPRRIKHFQTQTTVL